MIMQYNATSSTLNLVDTASSQGVFNLFLRAAEKADLLEVLKGVGLHTIFAPTDEAFENLASGQLDRLLKPENKLELTGIVGYHVLKGRRTIDRLVNWSSARTANGLELQIAHNESGLTVDGARITLPDLRASNGVLHGIDKLNLPTARPV